MKVRYEAIFVCGNCRQVRAVVELKDQPAGARRYDGCVVEAPKNKCPNCGAGNYWRLIAPVASPEEKP